MKMENKYYQIIGKEDLDIGMEYTIKAMKCVTTKYRKKIVIIIVSKCEMVDLLAIKRFVSKASDLKRN